MIEPESIFDDRYELETPIGEGAMARVFRAYDNRLQRPVALKILREQFANEEEFIERFRQEARLAAGLAHPNIVGVYDVGEEHGQHYMVMEYVEGENLKALIAREAPMPIDAVIPLMRQLAAALDYAHDHGVVHRDIKPENILITAKREVKVGDFGIARALASAKLTATGTVLGSVSYLSPEQASGRPATAASDLYAAGMVLYEMLTRRLPFAGPNPVAVAMAQVNDAPASPRVYRPDISPAVEAVVLKAIAKGPTARFSSGYDLMTALAAPVSRTVRESTPAPAPTFVTPIAPVLSAPPARDRRPRQGAGGALFALITTAALLIAAVLVGRSLANKNDNPTNGALTGTTPTASGFLPTTQPNSTESLPAGSVTAQIAAGSTQGANVSPAVTTSGPTTQVTPNAAVQTTPTGAVVDTSTAAPATDTPAPSSTPQGSAGNASVDLTVARNINQQNFTPIGPTTVFPANASAIYAVTLIHHKPKGAHVLFHWQYPDGSVFDFDNKYVTKNAGEIPAYAVIIPRGPGAYHVTTLINGHPLASADFTVSAGAQPTAG